MMIDAGALVAMKAKTFHPGAMQWHAYSLVVIAVNLGNSINI